MRLHEVSRDGTCRTSSGKKCSSIDRLDDISSLPDYQYEFYTNWYTAVVRELVHNQPVELDCSELAKMVNPSVLPKQVKKSIELLEKLKVIRKMLVSYIKYLNDLKSK